MECLGLDASVLTVSEQEAAKTAQEEEQREYDIARGNPLLNPKDFNVKRRCVAGRGTV